MAKIEIRTATFIRDFYIPGSNVFLCDATPAGQKNILCIESTSGPIYLELKKIYDRHQKDGRAVFDPPLIAEGTVKLDTDCIPGPNYTAVCLDGRLVPKK